MLITGQLLHAPFRLSAVPRSVSLAIPCRFCRDAGAAGWEGNTALPPANGWLGTDMLLVCSSGSSLAPAEVHGKIPVQWYRVQSLPEMSPNARPR